MIDLDDLDLSTILNQDIVIDELHILVETVVWLLFMFALVCIFRAADDGGDNDRLR